MKALVATGYGPVAEVAVLAELPVPAPGPGELLVRVEAAALNPLDVKLTTGEMRELMPVVHPLALGVDAAGTVAAVGEGVTRFAVGDDVMALTFPVGALAEYTVVADGPTVLHRPAGLSVDLAAALPTGLLTAAALTEGIAKGDTVLVAGAAGGIGSLVVQLAADAGALVLATARPADAEYVRGLGAVEVIDHSAGGVVDRVAELEPSGVDLLIDLANAGPDLARAAAAVRPGGRVRSPLGGPEGFGRGVTAEYVGVEGGVGRLAELVDRAATGRLAVEVTTRPFAEAPAALAGFAAGRRRGKTVLVF